MDHGEVHLWGYIGTDWRGAQSSSRQRIYPACAMSMITWIIRRSVSRYCHSDFRQPQSCSAGRPRHRSGLNSACVSHWSDLSGQSYRVAATLLPTRPASRKLDWHHPALLREYCAGGGLPAGRGINRSGWWLAYRSLSSGSARCIQSLLRPADWTIPGEESPSNDGFVPIHRVSTRLRRL